MYTEYPRRTRCSVRASGASCSSSRHSSHHVRSVLRQSLLFKASHRICDKASAGGWRLLILELVCDSLRPVDERAFDDIITQDVDERVEKDVAVRG